ncbi:hypothetical protein CCMA1212_001795 [Trichoderma ghanense]|uniref:Uncharacterized protein n=1 Tax=Trichoderma ghanense TaxID=65468 RepID=A0ABY2HDS1_9HYPO
MTGISIRQPGLGMETEEGGELSDLVGLPSPVVSHDARPVAWGGLEKELGAGKAGRQSVS